MHFSTTTLIALLSAAGTVLADPYALVLSFPNTGCTGGTTTSSSYLNKGSSVGCANALPPNSGGSSTVSGSGCKTYFFVDANCKTNYFGNGNPVPDSKCYGLIGSYSVVC